MPVIRTGMRIEIAPFEDMVEQAPAPLPEIKTPVTKRAAHMEVREAKATATQLHRAAQGRGDPVRAKAIRKASNKRKGRSTKEGLGAPLILAIMAKGEPVTRKQLQKRFDELGLSVASVSAQLSKFKARGWLRQLSPGVWEATPRGLDAKELKVAVRQFNPVDETPSAPPAEDRPVELHGHFDDTKTHEQTS